MSVVMTRMQRHTLLQSLGFAALFTAGATAQDAAAAPCLPTAVTIVDDVMGVDGTSAVTFFEDTGDSPPLRSTYIGYTIKNNAATRSGDLWVKLDGFAAGRIQLATSETGIAHVGELAAGARKQVFFYLTDPLGVGSATINQPINVRLFPTDPTLGVMETCSYADTITSVDDRGPAAANKVNASVVGPNPPELGGVVTISVVGETGTVGSSLQFAGTPASLSTWQPQAFKLFDAGLELWFNVDCPDNAGGVPTGNPTHTFPQKLVAPLPGSNASCYRMTYKLYAVASTTAPTAVHPVNFIASGMLMKHTGVYVQPILPVQPAVNFATLTKTVTPAKLLGTGNVTYSVTINNGGTGTIRVDKIVDALPASPANATYVANSTTFAGVAAAEPIRVGQTANWTSEFLVGAGTTATLTYTVTLPSTVGTYRNSAVAFMGPSQLDTTVATTDTVPAVVDVIMGNANLSISGVDAPDPVEVGAALSYTLTVGNAGPEPAQNAVARLVLPAGTGFLNTTAAGWTCSQLAGTVTCTRASVVAGSTSTITVNTMAPVATGVASATASVTSATADSNAADDSATITTQVNNTPAAPTVATPTHGSTINDPTPTITGTGDPNVTINVIIDGMQVGTTTSDGSGAWSFTPAATLTPDVHTVTATATRGAGTSAQANTNTFTVVNGCLLNSECSGSTPVCKLADNTCVRCLANNDCPTSATCTAGNACLLAAPVVDAPANGSTLNDPSPAITGSGPANVTINVIVDMATLGTTTTDGAGAWTFTPAMNLMPGSHSVSATATSGTGALAITSAQSNTNTFTLVNGCLLNSECSGATPVCRLADNTCVRCIANGDCPTSATCGGSNTCSLAAPVVVAPADGSTTNSTAPAITGTGPFNVTINVVVDGVLIGTTTTDGAGAWSFSPSSSLSVATHTVTATATSGAGVLAVTSAASNTNSFTIINGCLVDADCSGGSPFCETTGNTCVRCLTTPNCPTSATCNSNSCTLNPPVVTVPITNTTTNNPLPPISGTGPANVTINVIIDGTAVGTTTTNGAGDWTFTPTVALAPGDHVITATATAGAGALAVTSPTSAPVTIRVVSGCLLNSECGGGTPVCRTSDNVCVRCLVNTDCSTSATCTAANTCVLAAPQVATPVHNTTINDPTPDITGLGPANTTITVTIDGNVVGTTTADASGNWSFTTPMDLVVGPHTVSATASSGAGVLTVTSAPGNTNNFAVVSGCLLDAECSGGTPVCRVADNVCVRCLDTGDCPAGALCGATNLCSLGAPDVTAPADNAVINNRRPDITGTSAPLARVTVTVDGNVLGSAVADATGNWTLTPTTDLSFATHTVSAVAQLETGALTVTSAPSSTTTFRVVDGCVVNSDCTGATPVCNTADNQCVRCLADLDCPVGAACTAALVCALAPPSVTSPTANSVTPETRPVITGRSVPGSEVTVYIDGVSAGVALTDTNGDWSFTPTTDLSVGSHTVAGSASLGSGPTLVTSTTSIPVDFKVGCLIDANCSTPNPVCDTSVNVCVECLVNTQCPMAAPICALSTHTCATACTSNSECTAPTPFCAPVGNARAGQCVECLLDTACAAPEPRCEATSTDTCVACLGDGDCTMGRCDVPSHSCVPCLGDADCSGNNPICQVSTHQCRPCANNNECSGTTPLCALAGPVMGACVGCVTNADCTGGTPICDDTSHQCRPCALANAADCSGTTPACETAGPKIGQCVACTAAEPDACMGALDVCDTDVASMTLDTCVECLTNSHCPMAKPLCNTSTRTCSETCVDSAQCAAPTPRCAPTGNVNAGQCVECTADAHCVSGRRCDATATDTCVECLTDADCGTEFCVLATHTCESCRTNADCPTTAPICDATQHSCRGCTAMGECGGSTPFCVTAGMATGQCAECRSTADCPANEPVCDAASLTCRPCTANSDCSGDTPACELTGTKAGRCVQCTGSFNQACMGATPVCDPAADICVGCLQNQHCPMATPFCAVSTRTCSTTCTADSQCSGATPVCAPTGNPLAGTCVQCVANSSCSTNTVCDNTATDTCVACVMDSQCSGSTPRCSTAHTCVACVGNSDCPTSAPVCNTTSNTCRACSGNADCSGTTPACALTGTQAGTCVACTADMQCSGATPVCNTLNNTCAGCRVNTDCPLASAPRCDATSGTCTGCTADTECGAFGATPVCGAAGTCTQCREGNTGQCSGATPACNGGTCSPCRSNSECGGDAPMCESDGRCVAIPREAEFLDKNNDGIDDRVVAGGGCLGCTTAEPHAAWLALAVLVLWRMQPRRRQP